MKLKDLENIFHEVLDGIYAKEEVTSFFFLCTESFYNISRLQLALDPEITITKEEQGPIFEALEALKNEKPIQYILKETEFYGLPFKVNENTLIPRPETEELISLILQNFKTQKPNSKTYTILDIGTGSGCIAISLAKNIEKAQVYAMDVSVKAIEKAKENATLNEVDVNFIEADILNEENVMLSLSKYNIKEDMEFDTIVSNPPYVRNLEKQEIKSNVLDNEPHLALFVDDDNPLIFYKAITEFAIKKLKPNGKLFFEINEYFGEETKVLVGSLGFKNVEIIKDIFGKDRMLKANK